MPSFPKFRFDLISFWIGFFTALFLWFALSRLKGVFTIIRNRLAERRKAAQKKRLSWVDSIYRQAVYQKAQRGHIVSTLFSLDEIALPPKLIAPPLYLVDPFNNSHLLSIADQVIPYLPDWPELLSHYQITKLTIPEALSNGVNIAIMGQPGSGRSFALAYFASMIAKKDPLAESFSTYIPIYIHVVDLLLAENANMDPLDLLIDTAVLSCPDSVKARIPLLFKQALDEKRIILLLDGLDELPEEEFKIAVSFIQTCTIKYPKLQIVTTINTNFVDNLTFLGFYPLSLTSWNYMDRGKFLSNWSKLWSEHLSYDISQDTKRYSPKIQLLENWLNFLTTPSPLEITLAAWTAFSGHLSGLSSFEIIESFFQLIIPELPHQALEAIASKFLSSNSAVQQYNNLESAISKYKPDTKGGTSEDQNSSSTQLRPKKKKGETISSRSRILSRLVEVGLLQEHSGDSFRFNNPLFTGYLGGFTLTPDLIEPTLPKWAIRLQAMRLYASICRDTDWISNWIELDDPPLFTATLTTGRWLRDIPTTSAIRNILFKKLAYLLNQDQLPFSLRLKFLAVFNNSDDPTIGQFFKQLLVSSSSYTRRIALIGLGAIRQTKYIDDLVNAYSDTQPEVRVTACLAIAAINAPNTSQILAETLMKGDENLRQAAAEAFAYRGDEGFEVIKEAIEMEDLLTRRAAVHGLVLIHTPWSKALLEKTSIQDGQWIVRNAAGQALESIQRPSPCIPQKLKSPSEADWLITYASKQGLGIPAGDQAADILQTAVKSGSQDEKIAAMLLLARIRNQEILQLLYDLCLHEQGNAQETALYTIWILALSDFKLTSGIKAVK
jgi:HEAT repeat protein